VIAWWFGIGLYFLTLRNKGDNYYGFLSRTLWFEKILGILALAIGVMGLFYQ